MQLSDTRGNPAASIHRAAEKGCSRKVVLLVGVVLYLIAPYVAPYVFEWMGYVTCYVQQLLDGDCTPVLPTAIQD